MVPPSPPAKAQNMPGASDDDAGDKGVLLITHCSLTKYPKGGGLKHLCLLLYSFRRLGIQEWCVLGLSGEAMASMEAGLGLSGQLWFPTDLVPLRKGLSMASF